MPRNPRFPLAVTRPGAMTLGSEVGQDHGLLRCTVDTARNGWWRSTSTRPFEHVLLLGARLQSDGVMLNLRRALVYRRTHHHRRPARPAPSLAHGGGGGGSMAVPAWERLSDADNFTKALKAIAWAHFGDPKWEPNSL
jgi:hypothetical protein